MKTSSFFSRWSLLLVVCIGLFCSLSSEALTLVVVNDTLTGQGGAQIYWGTTLAGRYGCWTTGYIPAGSSASENFATEDYGDPNVTQIFTYENSSLVQTQPQSFLTDSNGATTGDTATFYLGPVEMCTTNLVWNILNSDTVNHYYFAQDTVGDQSGQLYLSTGQSGTLSVTGTACTNVWTVHYVNSITFDNGSNALDGVVYQGPTLPTQPPESGSPGGEGSPTPPGAGTGNGPQLLGGSAPGVGQYNPTNPAVAGTNNPILFTSSPTNAEGTIIAQGDQALYTATVNGFNQDAANQQKEITDLNSIASNGVAGATGTNGGFTLTNYATATGQNIASNQAAGLGAVTTNGFNTDSNLLSSITNLLTRGTNGALGLTGLESNLLAEIPSSATNAAAATNAFNAGMDNSWYTSLSSYFSPELPPAASGAPTILTMTAFGYTLDFDPVVQFPQVAEFSLYGWKILLTLFYLLFVGRLYIKVVTAAGAVRTGTVPNVNTTFGAWLAGTGSEIGGNFIGVFIALCQPAVLTALYAIAISLFAPLAFGVLDLPSIFDFSQWGTQMGAVAYYLFTSFFPFSYAAALMVQAIVLQFSMGFAFQTFAGAARYIWG